MTDDQTIRAALAILESRLIDPEGTVTSPSDVSNYLIMKLAGRKSEVFGIVLLDTRHGIIETREMFEGTIDGAAVYPREIVRAVIEANAAAIVLFHNHPSTNPEPSEADRRITQRISSALALIDVRVLDHIVVGGVETVSMAERGMI